MHKNSSFPLLALVLVLAGLAGTAAAADKGEFEITVIDHHSGDPIACRMHLKNQLGKPVRPPKVPYWHDHFAIDGTLMLKLPLGNYTFEIERGPEYLIRTGHFTINKFSSDSQTIDLKRFAHMASEGWWSGDLNVRRDLKDFDLVMRADDLHAAHVVTWSNRASDWAKREPPNPAVVSFDNDRCYHLLAGADTRASLLVLNSNRPLNLPANNAASADLLKLVAGARQQSGVWIDAEQPSSWDLPVWLTEGLLDSLELAHPGMGRTGMDAGDFRGYGPDKTRFTGKLAAGGWSQEIYYHLLNAGLRMPPTAGSGSGENANPAGYNRLYVHLDGEFSYEKWMAGLRAGRVVVTNGPLIRPLVEDHPPGHVFPLRRGEELDLEIALTLSTRDKIEYLEVVKNGVVEHVVRLSDWKAQGGRLPGLHFDESGWFLVRAVAAVPTTYRFATTAPYYVELAGAPRISKKSVQFFLDWIDARVAQLSRDKAASPDNLALQNKARSFWAAKLREANAP